MRTIVLELVAVAAFIAFALVMWWPAALLVVGVAAGAAAWNSERGMRR